MGLVGRPHVTVRLTDSVFWQARAAWGKSSNEVSPFLTYTDRFDTIRWLASSTLIGRWEPGNVERAMEAFPVLDAAGNPTGKYVYNGNVANRALELLGKEQGMFIERKEIGRPGSFDMLDDEELDSRIEALAAEVIEL